MVLIITIITGLFAAYILCLFWEFPPLLITHSPLNKPEWLFGILLLCLLIWQLTHIRNEEYNVDESTWIANALAVIAERNYAHALLNYTWARPLTVLPLLLIAKMGLPVNYLYVKVMSLLLIAITVILSFLALRNLTTSRFALLFIFPLSVFYLTVEFDDFLAYNSELVCNVSLAAGIWLYSSIVRKRDRLGQIAGVGFGLGLLPFMKFQAIPGGLVVALYCLYKLVDQHRIRETGLLVISGLMPMAVTVCYCLLTNQMAVLIQNYFLYYVHYSAEYSNVPLVERLSPRTIIYYYRKQYTFATYWIGLLLGIASSLWYGRHRSIRWTGEPVFFAVLWAVSIYETIQAGTYFEHYLSLTLVPHTLLAAMLVYPVIKDEIPVLTYPVYVYVLIALCITFFSRTKPFVRGYNPPLPYDAEVIHIIRRESRPADRISVWGWADRYYVEAQRAPASRFAFSVLQMKPNSQQAYYLAQYLVDLQQHRPRLFLDAIAPGQFVYTDRHRYAHERFWSINQFIASHYRLIFERQGLRVYKLNSNP